MKLPRMTWRLPDHWRRTLAGLASLLLAPSVHAIDALELEVREITVAGLEVSGASVRLDLVSDQRTRLTLRAREVAMPEPAGKFSDFAWVCEQPVIAEPRFGCDAGRFSARGGPIGALDMQLRAELRTDTGVTSFAGSGLKVAGTTAAFDGKLDERGWQVRASTGAAKFSELRKFATPWYALPADITGDGQLKLEGTIADLGQGLSADVGASFEGLELTNEASTIVTVALAGAARLRMEPKGADSQLSLEVRGRDGEMLFTPIYFNFGANPLALNLQGTLSPQRLTIDALHLQQDKLLDLRGTGSLNLAGETPLLSGEFRLAKAEFPAAFAAYAANFLATSMIGDAQTKGGLSGEVSIVDNGITALRVKPENFDFSANKGSLHLEGMRGEIHWAPVGGRDAQVSTLEWNSGGAYGLSGGGSGIEFIAYGPNFALTRPAKLPVFDGAIAIENFAMGNLGAPDMEVSFKGEVEPISMPLLARAFGWPEFSGTIAASIPGVRLKDNVLTFDGNLESQVFGGRISGSNIRLRDPLGNYPEFFADVRARDLDLELVTRTFEVGTITGKLEADVLGLQLFGWTPTRFDARLATPRGDKSRHRISAKAVSSLSNVGGGGGGVVQALQSGVLRFFDDYSYDKLGITCKLRDDVCEMSGVEPAPNGYYIVKGAGIPRIDIVGNQGRVNWNHLLSSIAIADLGGPTVK
jgi:hypothetical protein